MGFNCGIVGLPNVGKSTLFNALTKTAAAEAANYPFCTIEPNTGRVSVPDERLNQLALLAKSIQILPTQLEFVDIAGLVKGAAQGEGLGNKFLSNIREVDAIAHVLRCFSNTDITHVEGDINPVRDAEIVETELMLADIETLEKKMANLTKKARGGDKEAIKEITLSEKIFQTLSDGNPARTASLTEDEVIKMKSMQLLTAKPVLYVCNVAEDEVVSGNAFSQSIIDKAEVENCTAVIVSAAIEAEIASLPEEEAGEFLSELGLEEAGLDRMIRAGYSLLNLTTFFTAGPKEARAWTVKTGAKAPEAAGVIHTDFQRGFIRAETIAYNDYIEHGGEAGCKDSGKFRIEGADYLVKDGDVFHFRFNV